MSTTKIIKRYSNRKLYDTERSCYVTLDEIALMIREGEELKIIDKDSGENLTSVTFAQIIFEAEKPTDKALISSPFETTSAPEPKDFINASIAKLEFALTEKNNSELSDNFNFLYLSIIDF